MVAAVELIVLNIKVVVLQLNLRSTSSELVVIYMIFAEVKKIEMYFVKR